MGFLGKKKMQSLSLHLQKDLGCLILGIIKPYFWYQVQARNVILPQMSSLFVKGVFVVLL